MWATGTRLRTRSPPRDAHPGVGRGNITVLGPYPCPRTGRVSPVGVDSVQRAGYVGPMSENRHDSRTGTGTGSGPGAGPGTGTEPGPGAGAGTGRETGGQAARGGAEEGGAEKTVRDKDDVRSNSPEGDLSTKLDPDVIPQQGDSPEVERTREHPEETGS